MEPSRLLTSSENIYSPAGRAELSRQSVVGDICCYFDAQGEPVRSALMQRVIGIEFSSLKRVWSAAEALLARRRTSRLIDPTAPANAARARLLCTRLWPRAI